MLQRKRTTKATAYIGLGQLAQLQSQHILNNAATLCTQPQAIIRLAGIMISHNQVSDNIITSHWERDTVCQHNTIHKTRKVHHFLRERLCTAKPTALLKVFKKFYIVLDDSDNATGGGAEDVVRLTLLQRPFERDNGLVSHSSAIPAVT